MNNKTIIQGGCYLPKPLNTFLDLHNIIFRIILNLIQSFLFILTHSYIVPMSLKVYWHISSRLYESMYVLHQMHVAIKPDACINSYFQTCIMHIFCFTQFRPPNTRTCIPQGMVQPKRLCATEQDDFLDQKCFKDCEGCQKRFTFVLNNLIQ